jgi:ubiquinone/menaquinone biosynthesis C-methylase UbiE
MPRRDAKQRSLAAFDRQAREYDTAPYGRHARRLAGEVLAAVDAFDFATVLDVGCGTGAVLQSVLAARPRVSAWGVDLSPEMVACARERLGGAAEVQVADAERLPLRDGCIDVVVCVDSLHHYPHPRAALAEMRRVTRPGGGLVIGEWRVVAPLRQLMNALFPLLPEGDVRVYTGRELEQLAADAGYQEVRCRPAGVRGQLLTARAPLLIRKAEPIKETLT